MKKLLLTIVVIFAMCGSVFAQHPETHWPGFVYTDFEDQGALYASLMINGEPVTIETANWDMMEVAAFVGDEMRKTGMFLTDEYVLEYGELFPTLNAEPIHYTTPGEPVTFKMYNHATGDLYEVCEPVIWGGGPITILTGEEHWEGFDDPDHPLMLNFTSCEKIVLNEGNNWTRTFDFEDYEVTTTTHPYTFVTPDCWTVAHQYHGGSMDNIGAGADTLPQLYRSFNHTPGGQYSLRIKFRSILIAIVKNKRYLFNVINIMIRSRHI